MRENRIIDTHVHYSLPCFNSIREELITTLADYGVDAFIEVAIGFSTNQRILQFCEKYSMAYAAIGVHPKYIRALDCEKFYQLERLLDKEQKIVAIGETGLDFSCCHDSETKDLQKKWFYKFIQLATYKNLPLIVHCREAYSDLIEILASVELPCRPGVIHSFSGTLKEAKMLQELGFFLGVGGKFIRDYSKDMETIVKNIPMNSILLETDSPYLSPVKGEKTNTSLNLEIIIDDLSRLKGVTREELLGVCLENSYSLFPKLKNLI